MGFRLGILACDLVRQEVQACVLAEGWPDVQVAAFPADCGRPPVDWERLRALLPEGCTAALVLGSACLGPAGEPPAGFPPTTVLRQEQCFHLVAGPSLVAQALRQGAYLVTPGWLADWRAHLDRMGFAQGQEAETFQSFARELVLFDTGVDPAAPALLEAFAQAVRIPARRIPVGLDPLRLLLTRSVAGLRLAEERRAWAAERAGFLKERADQALVQEQLARLIQCMREDEVLGAIEALFRCLFAPGTFRFLGADLAGRIITSDLPAHYREVLPGPDSEHAWTPSGEGFMVRIVHRGRALGLVVVDRLACPQYREQYLNLALNLAGVCGLALENARTHRMLMDVEKVAALGSMLAGIAHEFNTPIGVCLAAASLLQEQTGRTLLAVSGRSLTQPGLRAYLECASQEAALIRGNLERLGTLIERSRQLTISDEAPSRRGFRLRACIEEVIGSLAPLVPPGAVAFTVDCREDLALQSYPGAWTSILTNLIANSLRHGFKGRDRGSIGIAVKADRDLLGLDYRDDGRGLSAEAQGRIFDPFFTTDHQHGTGLGMNLVFNLVTRRLGGSIVCGSPACGVHFHIEVPI